MKKTLSKIITLGFLSFLTFLPSAFAETRCGWVEGYEGYDQWLRDAQGEWQLFNDSSYKPRHVAEGLDHILLPIDAEVVKDAPYNYYCACMKVQSDYSTMRILNIMSFKALPLSTCLNDMALKF